MKQNIAIAVLAIAVLALGLHAQNGTPWGVSFPEGPLSGCPAPKVGFDAFCSVSSVGPEMSINGGAYVPIGAASSLSFAQITGQLTPNQLPNTLNSTLTITGFTQAVPAVQTAFK